MYGRGFTTCRLYDRLVRPGCTGQRQPAVAGGTPLVRRYNTMHAATAWQVVAAERGDSGVYPRGSVRTTQNPLQRKTPLCSDPWKDISKAGASETPSPFALTGGNGRCRGTRRAIHLAGAILAENAGNCKSQIVRAIFSTPIERPPTSSGMRSGRFAFGVEKRSFV